MPTTAGTGKSPGRWAQGCYNPAAGALGHAVASLFGADPLTEMDEDLMRLKAYFETGTPARDAAQPAT